METRYYFQPASNIFPPLSFSDTGGRFISSPIATNLTSILNLYCLALYVARYACIKMSVEISILATWTWLIPSSWSTSDFSSPATHQMSQVSSKQLLWGVLSSVCKTKCKTRAKASFLPFQSPPCQLWLQSHLCSAPDILFRTVSACNDWEFQFTPHASLSAEKGRN